MKQNVIALMLVLVAGTCAAGDTILERTAKDKVTLVKSNDPAMNRAVEKARATLDEFLLKEKSHSSDEMSFALKVGIKQGKQVEYFWITPFAAEGDHFIGTINNEPELISNVRFGQRYKFSRSDIFDWTYADRKSRKTKGNFTACALLTHEPPEQAAEFRRKYGLECEM